MARKKLRIPAVVPRIVFSTIFVGVIPACVAQACTGGSTLTGSDSGGPQGVAQQCFDSSSPQCQQHGVAAVAFQCFDGSTNPACNFSVADAAFGDAPSDAPDAEDDADGAG
jgi:hypothetical protein